ncbi:IBR domain protein, putative [Plasmodium gallinaceum]|uniref:RBR-type E3 ubiquitin transferase n=1 Tax=Plasmodium gallinaceum TaxID=5849 RepID=A0A1J1GVE8_PLAGA|nr:IBR domain protein, putative [Plasmodium gallinaceum]CRG95266.1 IBR domain protein, putative [Plasmodium gallinaceum]
MNIPKDNINNRLNVTLEVGKDKKLKVVKTFMNNSLDNVNSRINNQSGNSFLNIENYEKGLKIYLGHFKKNFDKFQENNIYNVYNINEIKEKMDEEISDVMNLINVDYDYAYRFLKAYNFNSNYLIEEWFKNFKNVLSKSEFSHLKEDIFENPNYNLLSKENDTVNIKELDKDNSSHISNHNNNFKQEKFICPILLLECDIIDTYALKCGHRYSKECWLCYLKISLNEDFEENVIQKKCMDTECKELIKKEDWKQICDEKLYEKYEKILLNIYINKNYNLKKCPNKNCDYIIESIMLKNNNVICKCGYNFCFICSYEFHRPVTCSIIKKWYDLEKKDDNNIKWINIHTKKCPNCNGSIEKTSGCMHMKCICGYDFCWLCLEEWKNHKGGFYKCNKYLEEIKSNENEINKEKEEKKNSNNILNKYNHYKTRFDAHHYGENFSIKTQLLFLYNFCESNNLETQKFENFEDAIIQTIKCRKILKWSYAYAYFSNWKDENQKYFFEYHQGELERNLEILQRKTESINLDQFIKNRENKNIIVIQELTKTVDAFFKNICEFIENDFTN